MSDAAEMHKSHHPGCPGTGKCPELLEPVKVAEMLGLRCPEHGLQLQDQIGPFWCPEGHEVSAWAVRASWLGPAV